ncbi:MAG TPA: DinB family protein [Streptosporangiaceae bacterium]|nr:DinB family protein [Streptosporangiaceae bacterium]
MTTSQPDPPLAADELVSTGSEREVLEAFLDWHRQVLVRKVSGISEEEARRRRVPSSTTLAGLVKHMTGVERGWFQRVLAGRSAEDIGPNVGGGHDSWEIGATETVMSLVEEYQRACDQSRETAAKFTLDDAVPQRRLGQVSLRWIYVHMIEETARHVGHADILREQTDGATGVDG